MKKKPICFILSLVIFSFVFFYHEPHVLANTNSFKSPYPSEASLDLNDNTFIVHQYALFDEQGNPYFVTITPVFSSERMSNGTYKISYNVPNAWNAFFYAKISNNKFTSCYSPSVKPLKGSVLDYHLSRISSTSECLNIKWKSTLITYNTGFKAWISNGQLKTKKI